ncbi:MAG: hypothetical protein COS14_03035 [Bacteroidetes bacterium CG02_land_8_20_14_3_00_31_25]|nr:hypothetical protein [Bacteroidota bacterium]PIV62075.1 MAG: hypothetical protein COS14_03035 [Bacteroidetes bacterium CG02_land_8_20_14_3_00_31_25]PIX33186.1 MAG: hypothetical protein COZ59_10020 [Bacteroidetes bacterium CG_4_8_14_3_um_filter_31_14]PIY07448.1 MAG: hypothetical protein COZ21_00195 [Bacteroidetes bacterium CG_4_10_14_3_um_filter_31_20]
MTRIAGIQIEKDSKGRLAYARFNLKKHPEVIELLHKVGAIEESEFDKEFEEGWKNSIPVDEMKERILIRVKKLFEK